TDACEATTLHGVQSAALMDLRMACLDRSREQLGAVVELLAMADADVVLRAHQLVDGLEPLSHCADVERLQAEIEPPAADQAAAVDRVRSQLAVSRARMLAGKYGASDTALVRAETALDSVSYEPVATEVALLRGQLSARRGDYPAAAEALRRALQRAAANHQWPEVLAATVELMLVVGNKLEQPGQALSHRDFALGLTRDDPRGRARVHRVVGDILKIQGKYEQSEAEYRRALRLWDEDPGHSEYAAVVLRNSLAVVLKVQGRYEDAEHELRRVVELLEQQLGPEHPHVGMTRNNLAGTLEQRGKYDEAEGQARRAIEIWKTSLGPDHIDIAKARGNLANALKAQGRYEEAEAQARQTLTLRRTVLGDQHAELIKSHGVLANILLAQGEYILAEDQFRAALELCATALPPEHPRAGLVRANLALTLAKQGRAEEAEQEIRRSIAHLLRTLGADHPAIGRARENLASMLSRAGKLDEADREYRRSLEELRETLGVEHVHVAAARLGLARNLAAQGEHQSAENELRRSLTDLIEALGAEHHDVATARASLAELLLTRQRVREALTMAELAWAQLRQDDTPAERRGEAAFVLAKVLWSSADQTWATDPEDTRWRARALVERATKAYGEAGPGFRGDRARAEAWLAEHR
ncbi:MAG: tetratricopeptide repeat protein, partial [Deltaproteobacteria bacterium]|nr:tetratricopeptide repeat protein [Deltaproteobacteria bacterium]